MPQIRRLFVQKKPAFAVEAGHVLHDLRDNLGVAVLKDLRLAIRYDVEGLSDDAFAAARWTVFAEAPLDDVFEEELPLAADERALAVEYLPGQYDQRADSAAQCLQLVVQGAGRADRALPGQPVGGAGGTQRARSDRAVPTDQNRPAVACARVYVLKGELSAAEVDRIQAYLVNPVDSRAAAARKPDTLHPAVPPPDEVPVMAGFNAADDPGLLAFQTSLGMAMSLADLRHTQVYFRDEERREPTETELRMLDTYWSDHCRHTTFLTALDRIEITSGHFAAPIARAYAEYQALRGEVYGERQAAKPECLMDMALLPARALRQAGKLDDQEVSSEINACSIVVDVDNTVAPGGTEEWLLMFKNETHNHPTEIEPFGGAATCLGGAIRDPLSGRAYVYQSMRVTGSADPREAVKDTLSGKLPQRKITTEAANGFASYGNQIGLTTGQVVEIYDPGYKAKRMEVGAVVGAVPRAQVRREEPVPGDVIVLVGGRTGRDGVGGATGSSKSHTEESLEKSGAEVQKGDAPMERKLQRLFRDGDFCRLVKKCNDFGAGGVSVAIGELADGLDIDLDVVPRKYEGLSGTEVAIAESQERMAVVVSPGDVTAVLAHADAENLEATVVATVTEEKRLRMRWQGRTLVDLSRTFLDSNGAPQRAAVRIAAPDGVSPFSSSLKPQAASLQDAWRAALSDLNACSQRGLVEKFDCTIGGATVLLPFGGRRRRTPSEAMVAKLPVLGGETRTASAMSHAFFPALSRWSPFHGAVWAHVQAAVRLAAVGGDPARLRFTLQEYFGKLLQDPLRWGQPAAALLGALHAEMALGTPAIGGKDSMSGTFKDLDVPPTLIAFAVTTVKADEVVSAEFKICKSAVALLQMKWDEELLPEWDAARRLLDRVGSLVRGGKVLAVKSVGMDGLAPALSVMAFGNGLGLKLAERDPAFWFAPRPGSFVVEVPEGTDAASLFDGLDWTILGHTTEEPAITLGPTRMDLATLEQAWESPLEPIFPTNNHERVPDLPFVPPCAFPAGKSAIVKTAKPKVFIPVFPGTNCEWDCAEAFRRAGAEAEIAVFRNLSAAAVEESLEAFAAGIGRSQILMFPGGFSAGDEPEGSGKFIAATFRNARLKDAVHDLLQRRDGLVLGICNGFQALIKLGLVPHGEIREQDPGSPTLTFNTLRYASRMASTRITSNLSPWLSRAQPGDVHTVAVAHGEGRVVGPDAALQELLSKGQVATQYVDAQGRPSMDLEWNPNGSLLAIEGLTSPDGRVFGKMAHAERYTKHGWKNAHGAFDMQLFEAGVGYFS